MDGEQRDDGVGGHRTFWEQLGVADLPRWARWLFAAWLGVAFALFAEHFAAASLLPAPLGVHLDAAVTNALPVVILLLVPCGIALVTAAFKAGVTARPGMLDS